MTGWKRLVRDYEQRLDVSEAMIHLPLGSLMLRRIVHPLSILKRTLGAIALLVTGPGRSRAQSFRTEAATMNQ